MEDNICNNCTIANYASTISPCYNESMSIQPVLKSDTTKLKKTDLLGLTLPEMQQWLGERGEASFHAKQIYNWLYKYLVAGFRAMTNLPQALRGRLEQEASIAPLIVPRELHSNDCRCGQ